MRRFKYFICEHDLIKLAKDDLACVKWYRKKPKLCDDPHCTEEIIELSITIIQTKKDAAESSANKTTRYVRNSIPRRYKK
jgi:hypothetical protein